MAPMDPPGQVVAIEEADDWEEAEIESPELHHLPATAHPAPTSFLREVSTYSALALTSLNLAFSHIADLERLVGVLPPALRELGLAGCRFKQGPEELKRGWAVLGRKLLVLQVRTAENSTARALLTGCPDARLVVPACGAD